VAFKSEQTTVADVLAVIDRLCGGPTGWQHLQKKALDSARSGCMSSID
jgi:hypothetical protein